MTSPLTPDDIARMLADANQRVGTETLVDWNDTDQTLTFEPGTSLAVGRAIGFVPPIEAER